MNKISKEYKDVPFYSRFIDPDVVLMVNIREFELDLDSIKHKGKKMKNLISKEDDEKKASCKKTIKNISKMKTRRETIRSIVEKIFSDYPVEYKSIRIKKIELTEGFERKDLVKNKIKIKRINDTNLFIRDKKGKYQFQWRNFNLLDNDKTEDDNDQNAEKNAILRLTEKAIKRKEYKILM